MGLQFLKHDGIQLRLIHVPENLRCNSRKMFFLCSFPFKQKELLIDPDNPLVWFSKISKMVSKEPNIFMLIKKNGLRKIMKKSYKHKTLKTCAEKNI